MDENIFKTLQDYVATANSGKYSSWEEMDSKFPELSNYDRKSLQDYVATANSGKYDSWDDLNSKFPEFSTQEVGKLNEVSSIGSGVTSEILSEPYEDDAQNVQIAEEDNKKLSEMLLGKTPIITNFNRDKENRFQEWYAEISKHKGLDPDPDNPNHFYDYRAFYETEPELAEQMLRDEPTAHFTDVGKLPGHPTFSDESIYFNEGTKRFAGRWEDGVYIPYDVNRKAYDENTNSYINNPKSENIKEVGELNVEGNLINEGTEEDNQLALQGLRRAIVDVPIVGLGDISQTRTGEFIIPETALSENLSLVEVNNDGKIDFLLKYTDDNGEEHLISERVKEEITTEDRGIGNDLYNSLLSGLSNVNAMIAGIPELVYGVASVPFNLLADAVENNAGEGAADFLRPNYQDISTGTFNPLRVITEYAKEQRSISEEYRSRVTQFEEDILGSLSNGSYVDAGRQVLNSIVESAPSMALMAVTSGAGSIAGAGVITRSAATSLPFASGAYQEMDDTVPENVKIIYSLAKGFNEVLFEESPFGTMPILRGIANKTLGKEAIKDVFEGYATAALTKRGIPSSVVRGALSEIGTELSNEVIDVYGLGVKDSVDWRSIVNAGIVGGVADGSLTSIGALVPEAGKRSRADELQKQIISVMGDIDVATSQSQIDILEDALNNKVEELNSIAEESVSLTQEQINQITELSNQETEINNMIESDTISEDSKIALQDQLKNLESQKQQILDNSVQQNEENTVTEQVDANEQDVDPGVVSEVATETFFDIIINDEARAARLTELEANLRRNIEEESNLGIAQDPRQKAQRDLEFLRDLTEYAVLKIADGTVKTVEAFSSLAKEIGDFGEDVLNKAFYNAREISKQYIDTRPTDTAISEAQGNILTRMQDVAVDRTPATSKVTSKDVRVLTEGKIQGKVTITNRQALANQIKTLNRGAKDMVKNVREIGNSLKEYVKANKDKFKGAKITSLEYQSLARVMAGITNEKQLERALKVIDKALTNSDFRKKLASISTNQRAVKRKPFPTDLKKASKDFANINPRDLGEVSLIEDYLGMLESLSKAGIVPTSVSMESMQRFVDIANSNKEISRAEREARAEELASDPDNIQKKIDKLSKELRALGMTSEEVDIIVNESNTVDDIIRELSDRIADIKPTRLDVIKNTSRALLKDIKNNLEDITSDMSQSDSRELNNFIKILDIRLIEDKYLLPLNYVLNNILNNNSINGIGRFVAMSESAFRISDTTLMNNVLSNFRKVKEGADQLRRKLLATLYTRTEALVKDTRDIGSIQKFFGFQDYESNSKKIKVEMTNIKKDIHKIIKKYNKKDSTYWQNPNNSAMAGVYTILAQYRRSWTSEEISREYNDRLFAIVSSLDRLRNDSVKVGSDLYANQIDVLEKVVDDIAEVSRKEDGSLESVQPKKTLQEIWETLPDGYKKYYSYTRDFFESNKEEFFTTTRMFGKEDVESDWVNYYPMSYIDYTRREGTSTQVQREVDFTDVLTGGFNFRSTTTPTSGAGIARTIKGRMLPKDKIFNFDLLGNFEVEAGRVLTDIGTLKDKWVMNIMTDIRNNGIAASTNFEGISSVLSYRDILIDRVVNDERLISQKVYGDPSGLEIAGNILRTTGTVRTLGGSAQFIKQTTPLSEIAGRLKNPKNLGVAFNLLLPHNRGKVSHLLKEADVQLRANQESLFSIKKDTASLNKEMDRSIRSIAKAAGMKYQELLDYAGKASLYPLISTDKYIAEVGWLALYLDNVSKDGVVDLTADVNLDAVGYADLTNSVVMNASDPAMQGDYARSMFKWVQPMMGFSTNTAHNFSISLSKLRDAVSRGDTKDIRRYSQEAVGNIINAGMFVAFSWGTRSVGIWAGLRMTEAIIKQTEDDEDRKKELLKIAKEEFDNRRVLNNARTINYAINDMLTRGILSDVTTPIIGAINDMIGVQEFLFGKEELRKAKYTYAPFTSSSNNPYVNAVQSWTPVLGVIGMGATSIMASGENIASVFETHEDFIKSRNAIATADGEDIIIDEGYLTEEGIGQYGIPSYLENTNYIAGMMGIVSLTGLADQTTNTMLRNTKSAVNKLVEKDKGKAKTGDWERRLKEDITSFDSYTILGQKEPLTPEEMREYNSYYLEQVVDIRNRVGDAGGNMTQMEIEGVISKAARDKTESKILMDKLGDIETKVNRLKVEVEGKIKLRESTLDIQKVKRGR